MHGQKIGFEDRLSILCIGDFHQNKPHSNMRYLEGCAAHSSSRRHATHFFGRLIRRCDVESNSLKYPIKKPVEPAVRAQNFTG